MTETLPVPQPGPAAPGTCRFPYDDGRACTRPPKPRQGERGPAPAYCWESDEGPGQPVHNPVNAHRARARQAASGEPEPSRAPVSEARATAASSMDRCEQLGAALRETLELFEEALAAAGDPDAAAAQIAAQVAD